MLMPQSTASILNMKTAGLAFIDILHIMGRISETISKKFSDDAPKDYRLGFQLTLGQYSSTLFSNRLSSGFLCKPSRSSSCTCLHMMLHFVRLGFQGVGLLLDFLRGVALSR